MQNALSSDASFYKQLFERTHTINLIIDFETGQIVEANPAACTFYGYSYAELLKKRIIDINTMPERGTQAMMERVVSGEHMTFQTQHYTANKRIVEVEVFASRIDRGTKTYLYAIVTDITAQKQAEKALRESEAIYRLFAQNMPDSSVVMFDANMRHTLTEGPFLKTFGPIYNELLGKTPQEALPKALADSITPVYQRALNGEAFNYERITETYAYESFVAPIRDENGQIIGGMILSHDISKRHFATMALHESETRYQSVISAMSEGVVVYTQDGIQSCNLAAEQILGLTANQLMGRSAMDSRWRAIHEDGLPFPGETHPAMSTLKTGQPLTNVIMGVHKPDDSLVWISINSRPMIHPDETQPYAVVATFVDVTERKIMAESLRESEAQLRMITDNMRDVVTYSDADDIIQYVNRSADNMMGFQAASIVGKSRQDFVHPDDWQSMTRIRQVAINSHRSQFEVEGRVRHVNGHTVSVETVGALLYDDEQLYKGGVYITRDISERKRLQEVLIKQETIQAELNKEIELSNLKSRMMERIAHEFRTPLTIIQVYTETLTSYYERLTADKRTEKVKGIRNQIRHITDMLDEIGLVVKGHFVPEHLERRSTDLSSLCREIAVEVAKYFNLTDKFILDVPIRTTVIVDPTVLGNALFHIMRNAVRFSDPSTFVTVRLSRQENGVELNVIDQGIGIHPSELPRIFDPFFRGTNINERSGLGVGLAIARAGIEANGGKIAVESVVGKGTAVNIWLPV